jgi:hypothetical protein
MNDPAMPTVNPPETWYCGQCARLASLVDRTATTATYVCPQKHFTVVELAKLKPRP